jgi:predicted NAD/FAD-dependent oxidoreductase
MFLHGHQPRFLEALQQAGNGELIRDWPRRIEGHGTPCQPDALRPGVQQISLRGGLKRFPLHLAERLDVRLETEVVAVRVQPDGFELVAADGMLWACRDLVLAVALEQSLRLLETFPACPEILGIRPLLAMFRSLPCLTLILGYPLESPPLPWDILYPGQSDLLQLVAWDSGKRDAPHFSVLVAQARPRWSSQTLDRCVPPEQWSEAILDEVARLTGPWARQPLWRHPHPWRYARADAASELAQPVQAVFPGGQRLGLAGEIFSPGGGVQAAWASGTRMAARLLAEERT